MIAVTREQVLAYRVAAQQLHRSERSVDSLAVLRIGLQEAMGQPAGLALAARLEPSVDAGLGADYVLAWTVRGAPHVHRRDSLNSLAGALWPLSEADAGMRLNESGPSVQRSGIAALTQFEIAVRELRAVVTSPTAKGEVSRSVTERLPEAMRRECRTCRTSHISDSAMRTASLAAGLELDPSVAPPKLLRRPGARVPKQPNARALTDLARAYLAVLGPASPADFAGYLGARPADVAGHWPDDVEHVSVEGRQTWVLGTEVDALANPPDPDAVRLLGPFDPYLQARDRELLVPDKAGRKTLWPVLGRPGALLVDGEIAGAWRSKKSGSTLTITVDAFGRLPKTIWAKIDIEAKRVAEVRAASDVAVKRG